MRSMQKGAFFWVVSVTAITYGWICVMCASCSVRLFNSESALVYKQVKCGTMCVCVCVCVCDVRVQ